MRQLPKLLIVWTACQSSQPLVWDSVRQKHGRLCEEFLPAFAPELNPVEYLWSHWK
jgi:transposase